MRAEDLKDLILSLTQDVILGYKSDEIFINPWNERKFEFGYQDINRTYDNIDKLMNDQVIHGKSLTEICKDLEVL